MIVKPLHHLEQVPGRLLLVGEDEDAQAAVAAGAVVEAPAHIGRAALLAALENERADLASRRLLRLELLMNMALGAVEQERHDGARLGADAQPLGGEELVIGVEALQSRAGVRLALGLRLRCGGGKLLRGGGGLRSPAARDPVLRPRVERDAERLLDQHYEAAALDLAGLDFRDGVTTSADPPAQLGLGPATGNAREAQALMLGHRVGCFGHDGKASKIGESAGSHRRGYARLRRAMDGRKRPWDRLVRFQL